MLVQLENVDCHDVQPEKSWWLVDHASDGAGCLAEFW